MINMAGPPYACFSLAYHPCLLIIFFRLYFIYIILLSFSYKEAYEFLKPFQLSKIYGDVLADIRQFNMYILDISDTIWRNKAFVDRTKSLCYSIPR